MDVPPLSTPDLPSDKSQSSKIIPELKEEVCNDDTETIINTVLENCRSVEYIRPVGEAWRHSLTASGNAPNIYDGNKWGQEMLDQCLVNSTTALGWNLIYILVVLLTSVIFTFPAILIPQQNSMEFPEYWWDVIIPVGIGNSLFSTLHIQLECKVIFRFKFLNSFKLFLRLYGVSALASIIPVVISHLTWTVWFGNNHPMPFFGFTVWVIVNIVLYVHLWFEFPSELRMEPGIRERIRSYFLYCLWSVTYGFQVQALQIIFDKIPIENQWIMAIILPLWREMNVWVKSKLLEGATDYNLTVPIVPKLTATLGANLDHAFFVAMLVANSTTLVTTYAILAVDFILNLHMSYQIIKFHRKIVSSDGEEAEKMREKTETTMQLFAIETVEVLAPLTYAITFLIAYNGPNATILGNIRNGDFSYKEVEDVESFVRELIKMILVDFASLIISAIVFWKLASINFFQEGYKMMKLYWPLIAVKLGLILFVVIIDTNHI